jgi:alanyl-tRNA synthetase
MILDVISKRFFEFGLPLHRSKQIIPNDTTTLFVTAGMQLLKHRFEMADHMNSGNIQDCVRTNDIESVGDGQHLTYFQMVGSFGFATYNYEMHVELWHSIVKDLKLPVEWVHCHPDAYAAHARLWLARGYKVREDDSCRWTDGNIGGYCSEMFVGDLEIGNLVNPLGHSVDVGFGLERMTQIVEGKERVDETSLFRQDLDPVSRDHFRTLNCFSDQGIEPGNKLRNYVCRRLLRRFIRRNPKLIADRQALSECHFSGWVGPEQDLMEGSMKKAERYFRKNGKQSDAFWWDSFGLLPEDVALLQA